MNKFNSMETAAIVLIALGDRLAAEIIGQLSYEDSINVLNAINRLGKLDAEATQPALERFSSLLQNSQPSHTVDGHKEFSKILHLVFNNNQDREAILSKIAPRQYQMQITQKVDAKSLHRLLAEESLQTKALIVSHCEPNKAAQLIKHCSEAQRLDLIHRVAKLGSVSHELLEELDQQLLDSYSKGDAGYSRPGGLDKAAAILNSLGGENSNLLDQLSHRDPELAETLSEKLFTFQNLADTDSNALKIIFQKSKQSLWPIALRGETKVLAAICAGLSERAALSLKEDIQAKGPQRKSAVISAQKEIMELAKHLEQLGLITLKDSDQWVA